MDRRIPHVRDVFSDMRAYDHSPRSRRKESDSPLPAPRHHAPNNQQQSNQNWHPDKTAVGGGTPGGPPAERADGTRLPAPGAPPVHEEDDTEADQPQLGSGEVSRRVLPR
ncbi:hypothetical protein MRX96_029560 [Rhipicephalus microplus]